MPVTDVFLSPVQSGGSVRPRRYEIRNGSADGYVAADLQPSTAYLFRVSRTGGVMPWGGGGGVSGLGTVR